jgi:hypothetical protein
MQIIPSTATGGLVIQAFNINFNVLQSLFLQLFS